MKVAIIHPWFPQYRRAFFDRLVSDAEQAGMDVHIYHGDPPPEWKERGDSVSAPYATHLPTRFFRIGHRSLAFKDTAPLRRRGPYDLIVLEQAVRNLETYSVLAQNWGTVAFWGHGQTRTTAVTPAQERVKEWLTGRGAWFFAYTDKGADAVRRLGFSGDRVTVVRNSIDTAALEADIRALAPDDLTAFREKNDLSGRTGLFIGGLDHSKRLPFLLEAAEHIHEADENFRLLIAGNGGEAELVRAAARTRKWIRYLGPLSGKNKALALAASDALMMPGRVGLVAVDSLVAAVPIVTTDWPFHAPEFDYLKPGTTAVVTDDSTAAYATGVTELLSDRARLDAMRRACHTESDSYSVQHMSEQFVQGLLGALHSRVTQ